MKKEYSHVFSIVINACMLLCSVWLIISKMEDTNLAIEHRLTAIETTLHMTK